MNYPCTKCGCCCKRVKMIIEFIDITDFPYKAKEDGSCEMLDENNMCKVYDNRPDICSVEKMAILSGNPEKHYKLAIDVCNKMMDEDNIPEEFRIK